MGVTCTHRLRFVRSLSALNHNNTSLICGGVTLKDDIDSLAGVPNLIAQLVASGAISPASQSTVQQFLDILFGTPRALCYITHHFFVLTQVLLSIMRCAKCACGVYDPMATTELVVS